jgi:GTPase SAR1 family protein
LLSFSCVFVILQILVVGEHNVGKTSLIRRFVEDRFVKEPGVGLGAAYRTCLTLIGGKLVKVHLHDVPTDTTLAELVSGKLLKDVDGAVLVYDQSSPDSLDNLDTWSEQIHAANADNWKAGLAAAATSVNAPAKILEDETEGGRVAPPSEAAASPSSPSSFDDDDEQPAGLASRSRVRLAVVANKSDLATASKIASRDAGVELAQRLGATFIETSARDSCNVDATFLNMARKLVKDRQAGKDGAGAGCVIC